MSTPVPRERRLEILVRARLHGPRAAADWAGVSTVSLRNWEADEGLAAEVSAEAKRLRGAWIEELEASCAEAARAVTDLTRRHAELARQVLDDADACATPGADPLTDVERLRLSAEVLADLRAVVAGAAETLTHYTAVCGAPTKPAAGKAGLRVA